MLRRFAVSIVFVGLFSLVAQLALVQAEARAQDRRQNAPGAFDFYVLALSWSPSYCASSRERRSDGRADPVQCGARPYSFVVHGLWPQYEKGFPSYCQVPAPRLNRGIVSTMLDLMPSPRLVFHEWDRHGTCSGLSANAYFETVRKARSVVKIPDQYLEIATTLTVSPAEVRDAFIKANSGLGEGGVAVNCSSKYLSEVRICMTREFGFRDCPEIVKRACRRDKVVMPPVRGGSGKAEAEPDNAAPVTADDKTPHASVSAN
jgi:ribonuclease T2